MANLEDSQDVDLDAILGELCALESQCDREIGHARDSKRMSGTYSTYSIIIFFTTAHRIKRNNSDLSYLKQPRVTNRELSVN